jgi:hypothetical protein
VLLLGGIAKAFTGTEAGYLINDTPAQSLPARTNGIMKMGSFQFADDCIGWFFG